MNKAAFEKWWEETAGFAPGLAEEIWQYFHREFPREAIMKLAETYLANAASNGRIVSPYIPLVPAMEFCDMLEPLWNGDQKQLPDKIEQLACPTCGGSGGENHFGEPEGDMKCAHCGGFHRFDFLAPCPDCKPKRIPVSSCLKCYQIPELSPEGTIGQRLCQHRFVDQRKGKQRKGGELTCKQISATLTFGGYVSKRAIDPMGWHEDHRTGDRRKAQVLEKSAGGTNYSRCKRD